MANIQFGSGVVYATPVSGNLPTNPTPFRAGILQEVTVDFKGDLKKLYGSSQFPEATARGKVDVTIKGKMGVFDPNLLNQLFFSQPAVTGVDLLVDSEAGTIPATPFQITVTHATGYLNPGGDRGVQFSSNSAQLTKVASSPATGQYSVAEATGIYTFAAADTGLGVRISYLYNVASRGSTITLARQNMGFAPELEFLVGSNFRSKYLALRLFAVTLSNFSLPSKLEDFWIFDFEGGANCDASGNLGKLYADLG